MDEPPKRKVGRPKKEKPDEPKRPVGRPKKEKTGDEPKRPVGRPKKEKPIVEEAIRILEGPAPAGAGPAPEPEPPIPGKALITKTTTEPEPEPVLKKTLVRKTATEPLPTEPEWVAFHSQFETEEEYDQWEQAFLTDLRKNSFQGVFVTHRGRRLLLFRTIRDRHWEVYGVDWKTAKKADPEALSVAPVQRGYRTEVGLTLGEFVDIPIPDVELIRPVIPKPPPRPTADEMRERKRAKQEATIAQGKIDRAREEAERAERDARHKREREERDARLLEEDRKMAEVYDAFRKSYRKSTDYKGWEKKLVAKFQEGYVDWIKIDFVLSRQGNPYFLEMNFKDKDFELIPMADWKLAKKGNVEKFADLSEENENLLVPFRELYFSPEQLKSFQDRVLRRE